VADELRDALFVYAETVVQDEWPAMAEGGLDGAAGWQLLDKFHLALSKMQPEDAAAPGLQQEMIHGLNALYDARRGRFHAAEAGLPPILWWNLIAGAALTIVFSYLFGLPSFHMHLAMVGMLGASIALVLALIILLDNPFRGQNHVSDAPFVHLVQTVEAREYPHD
jgi:ABC-type branched-subunit amino acid transport system permease subunit